MVPRRCVEFHQSKVTNFPWLFLVISDSFQDGGGSTTLQWIGVTNATHDFLYQQESLVMLCAGWTNLVHEVPTASRYVRIVAT